MLLLMIVGLISGVLGGAGFGGGTILIPLLTWIFAFEQKTAQLMNLLSFIVMSIFAIFLHVKNKIIDIKVALFCALGGVVTSLIFSLFIKNIDSKILKILFASFLVILGVFQLFLYIKKQKQKTLDIRKKLWYTYLVNNMEVYYGWPK